MAISQYKDSFDPTAMSDLASIMTEIEQELGETVDASMRQTIAARVMHIAGRGETRPEQIKAFALEALNSSAV